MQPCSTVRGASSCATSEDGTGVLGLRFIHFYPSQLKQLAPGTRVRAFGEIRDGFLGPEMIHPRCVGACREGAPVARSLTPVYPTTAGLEPGHAAASDRERAFQQRPR